MNSVKDHNTELAWAAGFTDGEGCFSVHFGPSRGGRNRRPYPRLTISQRSETPDKPPFVLLRFQEAVGVGTVVGPYWSKRFNRREYWYYRVYGWDKTLGVMKLLWPWLSPVKKTQAKRILTAYKEART